MPDSRLQVACKGADCHEKVEKGETRRILLPLDESVGFNAMLQKGNHIQVPRLIRWHYKIEPDQILKIGISFKGGYGSEKFIACMSKDGRITIPELTI